MKCRENNEGKAKSVEERSARIRFETVGCCSRLKFENYISCTTQFSKMEAKVADRYCSFSSVSFSFLPPKH